KINPNHKRRVPLRRNHTRITLTVTNEVMYRSEGKCECCGRTNAYAFERAHLINASQGGSGSDPANIVWLCGPSVNSGTCHHWADSTAEGREWRKKKRKELIIIYERKNRTQD